MAVYLICMTSCSGSQLYSETALTHKRLRFSEQGYLYWTTCKKEKSFWGKITSKENCEEYLEEKFTQADFLMLKKANFRCMSIDNEKM